MKITVIGGGPGGYESAIYAAKQGMEVTLVEKNSLGGTCLNRGCIPTKALLASSELLHAVKKADTLGLKDAAAEADAADLTDRKDKVVTGLVNGITYTLQANKVRVVEGHGKLKSPSQVEVACNSGGTEMVTSDAILLATGSAPMVPRFIIPDGKHIITSDELLAMTETPGSVIILGGGVIGCEIGQHLARMGSTVTIVEMLPHLLPMEDEDVAAVLMRQFRREKIKMMCGVSLTSAKVKDGGVEVSLNNGSELQAEKLLVAVGRRPYTEMLGLEKVGLEKDDRGYIPVDKQMRTAVPGIYAIGDIVPTPQLAHVAGKEGMVAVDHMLGNPAKMCYHAVPRCVYTEPEVAGVGKTQDALEKAETLFHWGRFDFMANGKAKAAGKADGFVKVLTDDRDILIGAAIVGAHATEILQVLTLAIDAGMTSGQVGAAIFPHPTMSEAVMEALHDVHGMSIHKI